MNHGGKRENSGRKKVDIKKEFKTLSIAGVPEDIELIKIKAKENGMSVSKFIIDKILER